MRGRTLALTFVVFLGFVSGCMTSQKNSDDPPTTARGMGNSMPGTPSAEDEEWSKLGREMRGDAPVQQTFDPLRDLMVSPKAQSIERSLGVDD
ncbi:MAG TPA: hypothetical protein VEI07_04905 [Planctomycetaceae bacterium]|nr:hypothetical protein [Planctomycetaceae bacterium]